MKKFDVKKYVGSKYNYNGNLYEFARLEKVDAYEPPYVVCTGIDTDKFCMIPPAEFEEFHNEYVVKG